MAFPDAPTPIAALGRRARVAARALARATGPQRRDGVLAVARAVRAGAAEILAANGADVAAARARGTSDAMVDRLALDARRLEQVAQAAEQIAALPDPVGRVLTEVERPNGLRVRRVSVPLGVVAMIYEARPNVTVEAGVLCLRAGDAVLLRGGSEAARSNAALGAVISAALPPAGLPADAILAVPSGPRDDVRELVQQVENVDLVIPRGGEALVAFVREHARVPVIAHAKGVCHLYLDAGADAAMAVALAVDGKLRRPGVCNALECLLVDAADAARLLPPVAEALRAGGCVLRGCERTRALVPWAEAATDDDWGREYLDRVLAVRVVDGLDGALEHVARHGSGHTEALCTRDEAHAARWRREVDAACVAVNASTRFHDGGELGLGAEIGIATSKLHWRGAMGLEALTTFQWQIEGQGQTRG